MVRSTGIQGSPKSTDSSCSTGILVERVQAFFLSNYEITSLFYPRNIVLYWYSILCTPSGKMNLNFNSEVFDVQIYFSPAEATHYRTQSGIVYVILRRVPFPAC